MRRRGQIRNYGLHRCPDIVDTRSSNTVKYWCVIQVYLRYLAIVRIQNRTDFEYFIEVCGCRPKHRYTYIMFILSAARYAKKLYTHVSVFHVSCITIFGLKFLFFFKYIFYIFLVDKKQLIALSMDRVDIENARSPTDVCL